MDYIPFNSVAATVMSLPVRRNYSSGGGYNSRFYIRVNSTLPSAHLEQWEDIASSVNSDGRVQDGIRVAFSSSSGHSAGGVSSLVEASSVNKSALKKIFNKLDYVYARDAAANLDPDQSRVALRGVVDLVEDMLEEGDLLGLDALLAKVDPSQLRKITSVAFLRSSYRVSEKLANWNKLYVAVWGHLSHIGQDPRRALRGLKRDRRTA